MIYIAPEDGFQETCPYVIPVDPEKAVGIEAWCNDEARAGHGYWTMTMALDLETTGLGISGNRWTDEVRYFLCVSDPNIAFEAKLRWAIHL